MIPRLIGMLHLPPLPGSPGYGGSRADIRARVFEDARILEDAGFDAVLMENYGDVPFYASRVPGTTLAEMTAVATDLAHRMSLPFGIQILRNDALSALAAAAASGAHFIRVNVLVGAMLTDQGLIQGEAAELLRARAASGQPIAILADVLVKHAVALAERPVADLVADMVHRGGADAVIVSGAATGLGVNVDHLSAVAASSAVPVLVGSGATVDSLPTLLRHAHGVIVGTSIKKDGITTNPIDPARAQTLARRFRELRNRES